MLDYQQKLSIIESFPELKKKEVSLGRINFQYADSVADKKNVIYHLHPNGNGYGYAKDIDGYEPDAKGMVNIRDFSEEELRGIIKKAIHALSAEGAYEAATAGGVDHEIWINRSGQSLEVIYENDLWNVYAGELLDGTFRTYLEAREYLIEEGFRPEKTKKGRS
ncbi:hypothetical protein OYT88_07190 [Sporolactobacillus sp. CQH2019]|uniref:hypothetical protein n=1 Tax=Sporolactobacillus sp. CQH2019 TaxID=3023512 RepID=UPI002368827B|nr:hypothetical protein [Sporolactobacillus sp. CQH2019]MDD9148332.1 hypothetical protein [Sporolactobacillus sp. CQH2019]